MIHTMRTFHRGFTLVEIIITMALFVSLLALAVPNLLGAHNQVQVRNSIGTILADVRSQQLKAMLGETEGRATSDYYGIHFENTSYTLFHGLSYSAIDSTNGVIPLPGDLRFSTVALPNASIIFNKGSGAIVGFDTNNHSVSLTNPNNNETVSITFNSLGIITGVQ